MPSCRFAGKFARPAAALASISRRVCCGLTGRHFLVAVLACCVAGPAISANAADESPVAKNAQPFVGTSFMLRIQPRKDADDKPLPITPSQVDQALKVIEKRLVSAGIREPILARKGNDSIILRLPGVEEKAAKSIREMLGKVAKLELHEVSLRSDEPGPDGKTLATRVLEGFEILPGYKAYLYKHKNADDKKTDTAILVSRRAALTGNDIALATPSPQQDDAVSITLNAPGAKKMIAFTKNMTPGKDRIAIVLDGEVISAPVLNQVPLGKQFIIQGLRNPGEIQILANALMNPLENALVIEEEHPAPAPKASN